MNCARGMSITRRAKGHAFGSAEGWVHNQWVLNEENSRPIIQKALKLGINFFDRDGAATDMWSGFSSIRSKKSVDS
jgi:hypothetical protein